MVPSPGADSDVPTIGTGFAIDPVLIRVKELGATGQSEMDLLDLTMDVNLFEGAVLSQARKAPAALPPEPILCIRCGFQNVAIGECCECCGAEFMAMDYDTGGFQVASRDDLPEVNVAGRGVLIEVSMTGLDDTERIPLSEKEVIVGSRLGGVLGRDAKVATEHAVFRFESRSLQVRPLGTEVLVNEEPIAGSCELQPGDVITLGSTRFRVEF